MIPFIWYIGSTFAFGWLLYYAHKNGDFKSAKYFWIAAFLSAALWPFVLGGELHRVLVEGKESSK